MESASAFLFSLNNVLGLAPFTLDVIQDQRYYAATNDPAKGPMFGLDDLTISFDNFLIPRHSVSFLGGAYNIPEIHNKTDVYGFGLLAETTNFTWDDLEVFYYDSKLSLTL